MSAMHPAHMVGVRDPSTRRATPAPAPAAAARASRPPRTWLRVPLDTQETMRQNGLVPFSTHDIRMEAARPGEAGEVDAAYIRPCSVAGALVTTVFPDHHSPQDGRHVADATPLRQTTEALLRQVEFSAHAVAQPTSGAFPELVLPSFEHMVAVATDGAVRRDELRRAPHDQQARLRAAPLDRVPHAATHEAARVRTLQRLAGGLSANTRFHAKHSYVPCFQPDRDDTGRHAARPHVRLRPHDVVVWWLDDPSEGGKDAATPASLRNAQHEWVPVAILGTYRPDTNTPCDLPWPARTINLANHSGALRQMRFQMVLMTPADAQVAQASRPATYADRDMESFVPVLASDAPLQHLYINTLRSKRCKHIPIDPKELPPCIRPTFVDGVGVSPSTFTLRG